MDKTRCQKSKKYKGNLSTKLRFPQNNKNALTTFLHTTDDLSLFMPNYKKKKKNHGISHISHGVPILATHNNSKLLDHIISIVL